MKHRTCSRLAGVLYLVTHVTSVAAVFLYGGSALDPNASLNSRTHVLAGGLAEVVLAAAVVGTGIALFPLLRTLPAVAVGYLALRTLEAGVILTGVVALLPAVARPGTTAGPGLAPDVIAGLHLVHDWTFLVGPGLIVPIHTALLAWALLRNDLAPKFIPILGLIGAPVIALANLAVLFGLTTAVPIAAVPIFAWELSLAGWLILGRSGIAARRPPTQASARVTV